ncbi:MAG: hypothetical protein QW430_12625 [Metallosphaera sp.]|uniref:hypothetical protein n=1 Tax=Metallosphaera sp. TaxID=2020860 RepID=UPI003167E993
MMQTLQKKLARREATKKVNEAIIRSILDFMQIFKKALGIENDLPLSDDERIVEFNQNPKIGVAYIKIKLNERENYFMIFIYSGQTSKPITPSDVEREIKSAFKWLNKETKVPTMEQKTDTVFYIGDRITSNAEKYLKKIFNDKIIVLRLRRNEKPINNLERLMNRLAVLLRRVAKPITILSEKRVENLIYKIKDSTKISSRTMTFIDRLYKIYKALITKYALGEDKLGTLIRDFYSRDLGNIVT